MSRIYARVEVRLREVGFTLLVIDLHMDEFDM